MDAPTPATLKFPLFGIEPATPATLDELPQFAKEQVSGSNEANVESPDNQPTDILSRQRTIASFLPRMQTIANFINITGAAVISGALVQMYYSGLAPMRVERTRSILILGSHAFERPAAVYVQSMNDARFGSNADICSAQPNVRFIPNSDRGSRQCRNGECLLYN